MLAPLASPELSPPPIPAVNVVGVSGEPYGGAFRATGYGSPFGTHGMVHQALHNVASLYAAQAPMMSQVADSVEPGSGQLVHSAAEGLATAARMADPFN